MVAMFSQARDVLYDRLRAVFDDGGFVGDSPDPQVTFGFPINEPPFFVSVDEIASDMGTDGGVSMGHAEITFNLRVFLFAQHSDLRTASDALMAYMQAVAFAVMADQTLCGTVDNAFPRVDSEGTSADSTGYYIAAAQMAIECRVFSACPAEMKGLIDGIDC